MALATTPYGGGGYEYQFVDTPLDMFVCKICQYPSREPYLSECCGHTFCKSCLEAARRVTTVTKACPICRDEEFVTIRNRQADRAIRSLHVFCTNKEKGCEWQGEVNNIINHLGNSDGCQFEDVTCSNDCGKCLQRQYLTGHVEDECVRRKVECQYCHITREHQFIENEHKEQCPKFPIACPNKCKADNIPREDIDEHRKMCPLEEVTCPNDCGMTLQQQYLTTHVKKECPRIKVDCQYCHITGEHQFIESEHKEQCPKFPIACPNKCEVGSVPRDDVEEHMKMCPLELVQCEYHVVGCEERMARKDQKKHNKEKMEEHLSFTTHQLTNIQHNLANSQVEAVDSKDKLTTKITQTGKDLATTKQHLSSAVKTIDQLIQRLQQTERDTVSQLEKYKDEFSMRIEQERNESKEQLAVTKDDLTLKLQRTENELTITKQELTVTKIEVRSTKVSFADALKELADTKADLKSTQEEARKTKDDLTQQLAVTKQEAKKTKDELTQKLTNTQRDLNTTKQQVATTCQNLTKAEKEHITLAANTDEVLAKLETKFQTKITEIETAAQKRITELETKLEQKTQQIELIISDPRIFWYNTVNYQASKLSSGDQVVPVIVKMSEYTTKKSDGVRWYSDSFYTHHKGYKMCLLVYATGYDGYMTIFLILMEGPYDDQLRWPLKGHCEMKLLNQISNSEHHLENGRYQDNGHKRVTSGERCSYAMWFSIKFISHEHLQKITPTCQYLKDDSIFLQVDYKLGTV
ncbi:TNF receptor-associated factor 3-like isoform X1 [Dysidea avara]|uniref:TNF receptor-associated factor 3-like isoform X1 n=1 Tax=Dysidea avara TaxID=196820 RepID=UPI003330EB38